MKVSRHWIWPILFVPVVLGMSRLHFDVEVLDLLPDESRVVQGLKLYQENFSDARELILTLESPDADRTQEAARTISDALLSRTNEIEDVVWQPPWIEHPDQSAELLAFLWLNQPPDSFHQLSLRLNATNRSAILGATREQLATSMSPAEIAQLSYDPYGLTRLPESSATAAPDFARGQQFFSSADGTFRILFVRSRKELSSYRDCARWLDSVNRAVDSAAPGGGWPGNGVRLGYTGRPAFVSEIAGGMERDTTISVGGTALIIAVLFWFAHRRWQPMLWLLTLLALVLLGTLGFGGLIFGTINVVSVGFAAILLGLAVDYAVVHYQEALAHPELSIPQVRRAIAPSIFWAAVTTISAFLVLNLGGLPGLAQLGTLVGVGVGLSALVMIFAFLPPLFPNRWTEVDPVAASTRKSSVNSTKARRQHVRIVATMLLLALALVTLSLGFPGVDSTANALRPRNSQAYAALENIKARLNQNSDPFWLIVSGPDETDVARRLDQVKPLLAAAVSNREISGFTLADALWPRPNFQSANRPTAAAVASMRDSLVATAEANGFASNSMALTQGILDTWRRAAGGTTVFWPTNRASQWIFQRLVARKPGRLLSVGLIHPTIGRNGVIRASMPTLTNGLPSEGFWLSGWSLLGTAIFQEVLGNLWKLVVPMVALVVLSLALAFRRLTEVLLSLAVLALSGLCLLTVMRLVGWSWNLLNLMALPLILGTGVDYTIFMQLALRRHQGDLQLAHCSVGRALLLCGATAVAGFGSLAWSGNAGMASLGQVCAVGIGCNMLIAVLLLPTWWSISTNRQHQRSLESPDPRRPSVLYRSGLWRLGVLASATLPHRIAAVVARAAALIYANLSRRTEIVSQNLLPLLNNEPIAARQATRRLYQNFARKLVDLWRYEAGKPIAQMFSDWTGWEHFAAAKSSGRGILLLTPHLGNWEFGAPLLSARGVNLLVLTLDEPDDDLTRFRKVARARWGIETLVVGSDPFASVEIVRRLEGGAVVALLIDRPPAASSVAVQLLDRKFNASIAAAELARASGCVLLPAYIPLTEQGYAAHILPEIRYDRAALRSLDERRKLTGQIVRAFEPVLRQHPDQWYHFVPIWPR